jgi:ribosome-associated protein
MRITRDITIDESELSESFVRSSGPGGQNVNKVATAVQLRFDAEHSPSLGEAVRQRVLKLAGSRRTEAGEIVIEARRYRTRERNRQDARERLAQLIARAARPPTPRKKTRPTLASKKRRLENKRQRSEKKRLRGPVD